MAHPNFSGASSDISPSEASSSDSPPEQLEYILEYLTQDSSFGLPDHSLNDLISLVCDEPSAPEHVPPYLLAAGCRTVFTPSYSDAYFEEALSAVDHLSHLEEIRQRYVSEYEELLRPASRSFDLGKQHSETTKIFEYALTGLRRSSLISAICVKPFNFLNCLATMNRLLPSDSSELIIRERLMATVALQKVRRFLKSGGSLKECSVLDTYRSNITYERAHAAMNRYLDLALSMIAKIEGIIDPIPLPLRKMGVKREDCVLHRISRHLIATDEDGYNPEKQEMTQTQTQSNTQRSHLSSPEL